MKRLLFSIIALLSALTPTLAQEEDLYGQSAFFIHCNNGKITGFFDSDVVKITYSCVDTLGIEHYDFVTQEVHTHDSIYRIPLSDIDSVSYYSPAPTLKSDVVLFSQDQMDYVLWADTTHVMFSYDTPSELIPEVGNVLVAVDYDDISRCYVIGRVTKKKHTEEGILVEVDLNIDFKDIFEQCKILCQLEELEDPATQKKVQRVRSSAPDDPVFRKSRRSVRKKATSYSNEFDLANLKINLEKDLFGKIPDDGKGKALQLTGELSLRAVLLAKGLIDIDLLDGTYFDIEFGLGVEFGINVGAKFVASYKYTCNDFDNIKIEKPVLVVPPGVPVLTMSIHPVRPFFSAEGSVDVKFSYTAAKAFGFQLKKEIYDDYPSISTITPAFAGFNKNAPTINVSLNGEIALGTKPTFDLNVINSKILSFSGEMENALYLNGSLTLGDVSTGIFNYETNKNDKVELGLRWGYSDLLVSVSLLDKVYSLNDYLKKINKATISLLKKVPLVDIYLLPTFDNLGSKLLSSGGYRVNWASDRITIPWNMDIGLYRNPGGSASGPDPKYYEECSKNYDHFITTTKMSHEFHLYPGVHYFAAPRYAFTESSSLADRYLVPGVFEKLFIPANKYIKTLEAEPKSTSAKVWVSATDLETPMKIGVVYSSTNETPDMSADDCETEFVESDTNGKIEIPLSKLKAGAMYNYRAVALIDDNFALADNIEQFVTDGTYGIKPTLSKTIPQTHKDATFTVSVKYGDEVKRSKLDLKLAFRSKKQPAEKPTIKEIVSHPGESYYVKDKKYQCTIPYEMLLTEFNYDEPIYVQVYAEYEGAKMVGECYYIKIPKPEFGVETFGTKDVTSSPNFAADCKKISVHTTRLGFIVSTEPEFDINTPGVSVCEVPSSVVDDCNADDSKYFVYDLTVPGFEDGKRYYYRAFASGYSIDGRGVLSDEDTDESVHASGSYIVTRYGEILPYTAGIEEATISTGSATDITSTTATLHGTFFPNDERLNVHLVGIRYIEAEKEKSVPKADWKSYSTLPEMVPAETGRIRTKISCEPEQTYVYCAYILYKDGLSTYGETRKFTATDLTDVEFVDVGASVLWMSCNLGAENSWETGDYFSWGSLGPSASYTEENYTSPEKANIYGDSSHDAAMTYRDVNYHVPTIEQWKELMEICTMKWATMEGVGGYLFTSKLNKKTLFFPAAGNMYGTNTNAYSLGHGGCYWTSEATSETDEENDISPKTDAMRMHFNDIGEEPHLEAGRKFYGRVIRAVREK